MIRVLLADDHELVRDGFAMILDAQDDIEVVGQAHDGARAVELARALAPDVLLMDIRMPVMDGIEATRRLRAAGLHRLAVLILTTFDLDGYVYEALRAGANGFLLKDAPRSALVHAIRTVAAGEALLAPAITAVVRGPAAELPGNRERLRPGTGPLARAGPPAALRVLATAATSIVR